MLGRNFRSLALFFLIVACISCKKLISIPAPGTSINSYNIYNDNTSAAAVLTGIYTGMVNSGNLSSANLLSLSLFSGMSADELILFQGSDNATLAQYYTNSLASTSISPDYWSNIYPIIYTANSAIQGLSSSSGLSASVRQQAMGEAEFIRAFCYFYLVNMYGDVPLVLTTDYKANSIVSRTAQEKVWLQIVSDLKDAQELLSPNYLDATLQNVTSERVRPTKWAAAALLSRTFLYMGSWADAKSEADTVLGNTLLFGLNAISLAFQANNVEAIWQLQPVQYGWNTLDAQFFIIPETGLSDNTPAYLSTNLLNSFEPNDGRRTGWIDSVVIGGIAYYYPCKYRSDSLNAPVTEYEMVMRVGEQYLVRAEAEAHGAGEGISAAIRDLNAIRIRAGISSYAGPAEQNAVLNAIYHERQVELFTEWGHRWFDLKRTGNIDAVMGMPGNVCFQKGGQTWNTEWQWYPIALSQLQADPNLIQNAGY